jgi:hypothetical protein
MAAGTPVWIKPTTLQEASAELGEVLDMGGTGLWLDQRLFASRDPVKRLEEYRAQIHQPEPAG